ncbi:unnamed protein product [Periconia digitata]|uniref:Xaa-Pro aminopeptidase n=1 Tax=Periconia digitata TaxID=1303443 RepID=A0A9W4XLT0_9PLEO|nr:unnamed protein product [Periconia digitata]
MADKVPVVRDRDHCWLRVEAASSLEKYPAKQHAQRVRDKLDVADGLIYLPGAPSRNNEDSDMPALFRQRRYFYYLSGCNEPDCFLTYDIQHDILALFIPRINPSRVIWNGRGSTPAEALDKYDIDEVHYVDELQRELLEWQMRYSGSLYVLHRQQVPESPQIFKDINIASLQPAMNICRMIKDQHEIDLIRKANDISSEAHKRVLANILSFKNEAQVEGLFLDVCVSKQAKNQAYDPIAASGPNAGTLHYDANNEDFGDRQLMCLDAGCEYELYASDITRTFPLAGSWPSVESENIYKLVQRMQESCIKRLAPGVRYLDLHILAHQIAIDGLLKLGILHNGTNEEIYKAGTSKAFFPHGLGHHVGLEVHDVGQRELMSYNGMHTEFEKVPSLYPEDFHLSVYDNDSEMFRAPTNPESPHLEEGMVVTVEPGIYFSTYALTRFYLPSPVHSKYINEEVVKRYLPVGGVRIEDDILITTKGYENLTTAPKGNDMLAIIRQQSPKSSSPTQPRRRPVIDEPLFRAPGIPEDLYCSPIKPFSRASTMPLPSSMRRSSFDFEPFSGPSLFSGFKGSVEGEGKIPRATHNTPKTKSTVSAQAPPSRVTPFDGVTSHHQARRNLTKPWQPATTQERPEMERKPVSDMENPHRASVSRQPTIPKDSGIPIKTSPHTSPPRVTGRHPWESHDSHDSKPITSRVSMHNLRPIRQHRAPRAECSYPIMPPQSRASFQAATPSRQHQPGVESTHSRHPENATRDTHSSAASIPHRHRSLQTLRPGNPYRDSAQSSRAPVDPNSPPLSVHAPPKAAERITAPGPSEEKIPRPNPYARQFKGIDDLKKAMEDLCHITENLDREYGIWSGKNTRKSRNPKSLKHSPSSLVSSFPPTSPAHPTTLTFPTSLPSSFLLPPQKR